MMVAVLGVACACVTCCSSMAADTYPGMEEEFNVSQEVCILSVSLFVTGLGLGPSESTVELEIEIRSRRH